ncbi:MAG: type II 3-dehydroquinate dehydratase [Bacteroidetes bacterium]|nr:type II 3-dehydroquinate dehydratase [Bacteroidota bacterium]
MKVKIINGPNLNLLGRRQTDIYGVSDFKSFLKKLQEKYPGIQIDHYQSNVEGEIVNKIQEVGFSYDGIIINAGGYTHTSVSIADALAAVETPAIEVHITNILAREEYRHTSLIAPACHGTIMGFGLDSYRLGLEGLIEIVRRKK